MSMTSSAQDGSETSSKQGSLLLETSTIATSETSSPPISPDTGKSTSSPESASGRTLSGWLAGATIAPCGQSPARANLSARQAVVQGYLTIATSGPQLTGSSRNMLLSRSLASRLQALTASSGSTLYRLTWVHAATPAGRWISRLRASAPRTSDNASIGWPTPTENDALKGGEITPRPGMICLVAAAQMAGWPTPREQSAQGASDTATREGSADLQTVAGWATPKAEDAESTGFSAKRLADGKVPDNLHSQTKLLVGWATPSARDYRTPNHQTYAERDGGAKGEQLQNQVAHLIPGASLNGSTAATDGGGLLNPEFSRWLQGIPATWPSCAPTATRSTRSSPRK